MAQHLGWFGHGNLGDDEMLRLLEKYLPDTDTFGGGTLITPSPEFYPQLTPNMVGVSLGVSANWNGEGKEDLLKLKKIYVRDDFSHDQLTKHGIPSILSADLWFLLEAPKKERTLNVTNLIDLSHKDDPRDAETMNLWKRLTVGTEYFAMSAVEDMKIMPEATLFKTGEELLAYLAGAKTAIVTRLHALIAAVIAGVPEITPYIYDPKCWHFLQHLKTNDVEKLRATIRDHIDEIKRL